MTTITSADGFTFDAYEVCPEAATASLVVIQEIFGVNDHIRSVVDRFAARGFHTIAPSVFDRTKPNVELGYDEEGMSAGVNLAMSLDAKNTLADIDACINHVASSGPVGVVGYCFGGTMAWASAAHLRVAAAVGYYGGGIASMNDLQPQVPTMLHFGELDGHIPMSDVEAVRSGHPDVSIHTYDADHGFNCDVRGSYDAAAADRALERTLAFFDENLR